MNNFYEFMLNDPGNFTLVFILLCIWCLVWKGLALWHAGRLNQKVWFIILLIVNTVGILEIIYLLVTHHAKKIEKPQI